METISASALSRAQRDLSAWPSFIECQICHNLPDKPVACRSEVVYCATCIADHFKSSADSPKFGTFQKLRPEEMRPLRDVSRWLHKTWQHYHNQQTDLKRRRLDHEDKLSSTSLVGGYKDQIKQLRQLLVFPLKFPAVFGRLGVAAPTAVLVTGPSGVGKTLLVNSVAQTAQTAVLYESVPAIVSAGKNAATLVDQMISRAVCASPAILILEQLDVLAAAAVASSSGDNSTATATFLIKSMIERLQRERRKVVVVGVAQSKDQLPQALQRPGLFGQEVVLKAPTRDERLDILRVHTQATPMQDVDLGVVADRTQGCVGADLAAVCAQAGLHCIEQNDVMVTMDFAMPGEQRNFVDTLRVTQEHFDLALAEVKPCALRELQVQVPNVRWEDIGGLTDVKRDLIELVQFPIMHPEKYEYFGLPPPSGVLLYGPPGCGKTLLGKAVATECNANFISVKGPELLSKFVGESEAAVRAVFRAARQAAPCVLFFDEIEAIIPTRFGASQSGSPAHSVLNQLLTELDGVSTNKKKDLVFLIGATNRPDMVDPAMLRPGRFDQVLHVPLPDEENRASCLNAILKRSPLAPSAKQLVTHLPAMTDGFSGADLAHLCATAGKLAIRQSLHNPTQDVGEVTEEHFREAWQSARRSVTDEERLFYEQIGATLFQSAGHHEQDARTAGPLSKEIAEYIEFRTAEWKKEHEATLKASQEQVQLLKKQLAVRDIHSAISSPMSARRKRCPGSHSRPTTNLPRLVES